MKTLATHPQQAYRIGSRFRSQQRSRGRPQGNHRESNQNRVLKPPAQTGLLIRGNRITPFIYNKVRHTSRTLFSYTTRTI